MHRLRGEADMGTDGNAPGGELMHGIHLDGAALQLNHLRPPLLHQARGILQGVLWIAIAHIGHIRHHQGTLGHPADRLGMVDNVIHAHRHGGAMALNHHAQGVAHQDDLHPRLLDLHGKAGVIGGQTDNLLPRLFHASQQGQGHRGLVGFSDGGGAHRRRPLI